jgi:nucleotide-binding universal stress UspA family protein
MKTQFADSTKVVEFVPHILDLKRILVPVDFSETSKKAFLYALKFAEQFNCEITLLSCGAADDSNGRRAACC